MMLFAHRQLDFFVVPIVISISRSTDFMKVLNVFPFCAIQETDSGWKLIKHPGDGVVRQEMGSICQGGDNR